MTSSTMRARGLRTANERARLCPNPVREESLERFWTAGEARPEEGFDGGFEDDPIGMPLYSAVGAGAGEPSSDVALFARA